MRRGQDEPCFIVGFFAQKSLHFSLENVEQDPGMQGGGKNSASPAAARSAQAGKPGRPPHAIPRRCSSLRAAALGHSCSAAASAASSVCRQLSTALNTLRCGRQARARLRQKGGQTAGGSVWAAARPRAQQGSALATLHSAPTPPTWQRLQRSQAPAGRRKAARPAPLQAGEPRWHRPSPPRLPGGTAPAERTWLPRRAAAGRWCSGRPWPAG